MKNPIFDIDNWREIGATLSRNKTRTFLTAFGIFWGTAMLALLWGGAAGAEDLLRRNFKGFATNCAIVYTSNTSMAYKGYQKGRAIELKTSDINRIRAAVPYIRNSSCNMGQGATIKYRDKSYAGQLRAVEDDFFDLTAPKLHDGRLFNESDIRTQQKVAVVGQQVAQQLFDGAPAVGRFVEVDNVFYRVIGVISQQNEIVINGRFDQQVIIPHSTFRNLYNMPEAAGIFYFEVDDGHTPAEIKQQMLGIIKRNHSIHPDDNSAVEFFDISEEFAQIDTLFNAIRVLALFVGFGTLLAGIIGVGNIMWIIVKERTQEIGIRRALGAKPSDIIAQVLSESVVLTIMAGVAGIAFAVGILSVVASLTADGADVARFQLPFATSVGILALFLVLGTAAGIIPAIKSMRIKPIEALNDK